MFWPTCVSFFTLMSFRNNFLSSKLRARCTLNYFHSIHFHNFLFSSIAWPRFTSDYQGEECPLHISALTYRVFMFLVREYFLAAYRVSDPHFVSETSDRLGALSPSSSPPNRPKLHWAGSGLLYYFCHFL